MKRNTHAAFCNALPVTKISNGRFCMYREKSDIDYYALKGRFPLRKIVLGSDRIGIKFNLLMCFQCQFSVGLR